MATEARCLSDIETMTSQTVIVGPTGGASETPMLRILDELADGLIADRLPGRRLSAAMVSTRKKAWVHIIERHGQMPVVKVAGNDPIRVGSDGCADHPIVVIRIDAT